MNEFKIFCNYGVLGAEKRNVYTYGNEHPCATCSDEMMVMLPDKKCFTLFENTDGRLMVVSEWGWQYEINEVLQGNEKPCFYAVDKDGKEHRVYLKEL